MKLYDKYGRLIPLCFRCMEYGDLPNCSKYPAGTPIHWIKLKTTKCNKFDFDKWWKKNNMDCDRPSDFPTFRTKPKKIPEYPEHWDDEDKDEKAWFERWW